MYFLAFLTLTPIVAAFAFLVYSEVRKEKPAPITPDWVLDTCSLRRMAHMRLLGSIVQTSFSGDL